MKCSLFWTPWNHSFSRHLASAPLVGGLNPGPDLVWHRQFYKFRISKANVHQFLCMAQVTILFRWLFILLFINPLATSLSWTCIWMSVWYSVSVYGSSYNLVQVFQALLGKAISPLGVHAFGIKTADACFNWRLPAWSRHLPELGQRRPVHLQQGHLTTFKRICHHTAME